MQIWPPFARFSWLAETYDIPSTLNAPSSSNFDCTEMKLVPFEREFCLEQKVAGHVLAYLEPFMRYLQLKYIHFSVAQMLGKCVFSRKQLIGRPFRQNHLKEREILRQIGTNFVIVSSCVLEISTNQVEKHAQNAGCSNFAENC